MSPNSSEVRETITFQNVKRHLKVLLLHSKTSARKASIPGKGAVKAFNSTASTQRPYFSSTQAHNTPMNLPFAEQLTRRL